MTWSRLALPLFVLTVTGAGIAALVLTPLPAIRTIEVPTEKPKSAAPVKPSQDNSARNVGGGTVPAAVLPEAPFERIAPLEAKRPLEFFGPPRPPLTKDEPFLLFQPVVENAGTLFAEGRTITLSGVQPVAINRKCPSYDNQEWQCGIKARAQFRALVRGRAISCLLPNQQKAFVETECMIGKQDLGEWLVEQGWAEAQPGSELESLGRAAKLMGRGIYGSGR